MSYILKKFFRKAFNINPKLIFLFAFAFLVFNGFVMVLIEPETFEGDFPFIRAVWYVLITSTTIGYGDLYPNTTLGKLYAMIFIIPIGIGLMGVVLGRLFDGFISYKKKREEGELKVKEKNHIVLINWTQKAEHAIEEILHSDSSTEIVIIDTLERAKCLNDRIHYVKGEATLDSTLEKANVREASSVIIFSDEKTADPELVDGKTFLVATAVENYAPQVHTVAIIKLEKHRKLFSNMKIDDIIKSDETISSLAVRSAMIKGVSSVYQELLSHHGTDIYQIKAKNEWKTYRDAFLGLLESGATLLSAGDDMSINQKLDEPIPLHSKLYIVCSDEVYMKLKDS